MSALGVALYGRLIDHWLDFAPVLLECNGDPTLEDRVLRNPVVRRARGNYQMLSRNIRDREEEERLDIVDSVT